MIKISHRTNTLNELLKVPTSCGIELDIRTYGGELVVNHEPFLNGESLNNLLGNFKHELLVLNVKEDGLESNILNLSNFPRFTEYFFLDQPFPTMKKCLDTDISFAVRASEYEKLPTLPSMPKWIWIDSFTGDWNHLDETITFAKLNGIKTCLVAPELQNRHDPSESAFLMENYHAVVDAVCTKDVSKWQ